jgi:hypothetical protein
VDGEEPQSTRAFVGYEEISPWIFQLRVANEVFDATSPHGDMGAKGTEASTKNKTLA